MTPQEFIGKAELKLISRLKYGSKLSKIINKDGRIIAYVSKRCNTSNFGQFITDAINEKIERVSDLKPVPEAMPDSAMMWREAWDIMRTHGYDSAMRELKTKFKIERI